MDCDLGHFDLEIRVLEPLENPLGPKVLPMSPERTRVRLVGERGLNLRPPGPEVGVNTVLHCDSLVFAGTRLVALCNATAYVMGQHYK
jgi:hypothetical protein